MKKTILGFVALAAGALASPAFADYIPYGNVGTVAATTAATATGNTLDIYFYGSSAGDTDDVIVNDLTLGTSTGAILNNHSSTVGQEFTLATNPGDVLEFELYNTSTGETYSSIPGDSADGYNHAYMTPYSATGPTAIAGIPAGKFVGFEDLYIGTTDGSTCGGSSNASDCDYNDDEFVVVGMTSATPELSSLALLGTSVLGAAGVIRRRLIHR